MTYFEQAPVKYQTIQMPSVLRIVKTWAKRADTRRALAKLSDAQLNDIGLSRHEAKKEFEKSFWAV